MADADLTQYNRTAVAAEAANAADALTSQLLVITDNKLITGELNGANQAPVNRALETARRHDRGRPRSLWGTWRASKTNAQGHLCDLIGGARTVPRHNNGIWASCARHCDSGRVGRYQGVQRRPFAVGDVTASGDITGANIFGSITGVYRAARRYSLVSVGLSGCCTALRGSWVTSRGIRF